MSPGVKVFTYMFAVTKFSQGKSIEAAPGGVEWTHFTRPTLRCSLESWVRDRAQNGHDLHTKLVVEISWTFQGTNDTAYSQSSSERTKLTLVQESYLLQFEGTY